MTPSPVRIVIAGAGLVGQRHATAIGSVEGVEIAAIVDPGDGGKAFAEARNLRSYESLDDMFRAIRPDGVILATPTPLHVAHGLACVDAGCPVLVEKPLGVTAAEAAPLVERARTKRVPLLVGHHRRYNPLIHSAKASIDAGEIGSVRVLQATCWFYKPESYFDAAPWRKQKGAGPMSVNLVHDVDLIRHLCGEVASVQAQSVPSRRGYENEDVAAALLRFENGALGTISVSDSVVAPWSWELTAREYPIYPPTPESCYQIGGSRGALSIPDLRLWSHPERRDWWSPITATSILRDASDPLVNQIAHFAAVIRGEEEPLVSGEEGLRTLRVLEAIETAANNGNTVHVGPVDLAD